MRCPFNRQRQHEALSDRGFVPLQHGVLNSRRLHDASIPPQPRRLHQCPGGAGERYQMDANPIDLRSEALSPYNMECLTADDFMTHQYHLNPDAFISVLVEQASDIRWTLTQLISKHVPSLSKLIISH